MEISVEKITKHIRNLIPEMFWDDIRLVHYPSVNEFDSLRYKITNQYELDKLIDSCNQQQLYINLYPIDGNYHTIIELGYINLYSKNNITLLSEDVTKVYNGSETFSSETTFNDVLEYYTKLRLLESFIN